MKVPVAELKKKLEQLWDPGPWYSSGYIRHFASYLGEQLKGEEIGPEEFLLAIQCAFRDLRRGTDMLTGDVIRHVAADRVPTVEPFVRMDLPRLYDLVFPEEFAREVKRVWKEVNQEASRLRGADT